jgi:hypothetical protein
MNKLNRLLELAGVELNERQVPPAKGDKEPEDKKPNVEVKPFRTRWFNNIIALRTGSARPSNPNANTNDLSQNK